MKRLAILAALYLAALAVAQYFPPSGGSSTGGGSSFNSFTIRQVTGAVAGTAAFPANVVSGDYIFAVLGANTNAPTISDTLTTSYTSLKTGSVGANNGALFVGKLASSGANTITLGGGGSFPTIAAMEVIAPAGYTNTLDGSGVTTNGALVSLTTANHTSEFLVWGTAYDHATAVPPLTFLLPTGYSGNGSDSSLIAFGVITTPSITLLVGQSPSGPTDGVALAASLF